MLRHDTDCGTLAPDARMNQIGTFNTIKATLEHVRAAHGAYVHISATLHGRGSSAVESFT